MIIQFLFILLIAFLPQSLFAGGYIDQLTTNVLGLQRQSSAPSSPVTGYVDSYVLNSDGKLYVKNSAGTAKACTFSGDLVNADFTGSAGITNANLANPSTTVSGQTCTLGSTCTIPFSGLSGSATGAQLPNPSSTTLGGTESKTCSSSNWLNQISTSGVPSCTQPAASDLSNGTTGSGSVVLATSPALVTPALGVASAMSVNKVTLTTPATGSTLTIVDGKTLTSSNTLTLTGTDGSTLNVGAGGTLGTLAFLSDPLAVNKGGTGLATLTSHSIQVGAGTSTPTQLAVPASGTVLTGVASSDPAFSNTPTLGVAGTSTGTLSLTGLTSGTVTIQPQSAAGTYNFNLPTTAGSASAPLLSGGGGSAAMTYGSRSGNTTTFGTTTGTLTSGDCAKFDANGNIIDAGAACSGGGSGTMHVAQFTCGGGQGDANTQLLIPFDDGSTILDYGVNGLTSGWTLNGSASVDATHNKFGAGGLDLSTGSGSSNNINHAGNAAFALGSGDYTVDFWIYITNNTSQDIMGMFGGSTGGWRFDFSATGVMRFTNVAVGDVVTHAAPTSNALHHIAVVRSGSGTNNTTLYFDGVSQAQATNTKNFNDTTEAFRVGADSGNWGVSTNYVDEVRISNTARWTSGFTPPTSAYAITTTITTNPGSWLSSVNGGQIGQCTANFTGGTFSSAPVCIATPITSTVPGTTNPTAAATTSAVTFKNSIGGSVTTSDVYLHCQ